jgi:predicted nucleic acid-binding protein
MQHVVDASVVTKWFLPEAHKDKAEKLLRDFLDEKVELTPPDLLVAEVGNILWKRCTLLRDISSLEAAQSYEDFLALGLPLRASPTIAAAALKLATKERHGV